MWSFSTLASKIFTLRFEDFEDIIKVCLILCKKEE